VNAPAWCSIASTSVVLPWSTCATMATLRRSARVVVAEPVGEPVGEPVEELVVGVSVDVIWASVGRAGARRQVSELGGVAPRGAA
jgi:hypothetical protein